MSGAAGALRGPTTWPATSEPPTFDVDDQGHPFWMVELATRPDLMVEGSGRSEDTYYLGGEEPDTFTSGSWWTMPQQVWDRLGPAGAIYYRLHTSESEAEWSDWTVSVDDPESGQLPFLQVGSSTGPAHDAGPTPGPGPATSPAEADVAALCRYLRVDRTEFAAEQDRYFARLGELLAFSGTVSTAEEVSAGTFRAAVRQFQEQNGLGADGIPGEDTLWELNTAWVQSRQLSLVRVEMDRWTPPGADRHDEAEHGYGAVRVRSDVAEAVAGLRADLNAVGVLLTSSGAARSLSATVTAGRSSTSIHYSAAAVDLATTSGMLAGTAANAENQLYVVTREGDRWRIWSRSDSGDEQSLEAVEWRRGRTSTRRVQGRFVDVTAAAGQRGLQQIGPRSTFPDNYLSAEWWHLQSAEVLVPWASQFGAEILSLATSTEAALRAQPGMWADRKRIFHRGTNGWW